MIAIRRLLVRNFLSYGNYDTVVDFTGLSQCYIAGTNGAGKSSLLQSILWCLSGCTMHTKTPGSRIRHWWSDDDTIVSIEFMDGSELTRIRTTRDTTELLYRKNGEDLVSGTISTTSNQQEQLNKILKFDYDVFCGSVFLSQYRQGWLKMSDQHRKQIFERIMGIDRVNVYATVCKQEFEKIELKVQAVNTSINHQKATLDNTNFGIEQLTSQQLEFFEKQKTKSAEKTAQADKLAAELAKADIHDMAVLRAKWDVIAKVEKKIEEMRGKLVDIDEQIERDTIRRISVREAAESRIRELRAELAATTGSLPNTLELKRREYLTKSNKIRQEQSLQISELNSKKSELTGSCVTISAAISAAESKIKQWEQMDGTVCDKCEQQIPHEHAHTQVEEYQSELERLTNRKQELLLETTTIQSQITETNKSFVTKLSEVEEELKNVLDEVVKENQKAANKIQKEIDKIDVAESSNDSGLLESRSLLASKIKEAEIKMNANKPSLTIEMAEVLKSKYDLVQQQINDLRVEAQNCLTDENPYTQQLLQLTNRKNKILKDIEILDGQLQAAELVTEHTKYVYKAYSDRRRIKSQLIAENRPYLNDRIQHYLNSIGLDIRIRLSEGLGLDSDLWGHEFQSGGERARAELSLAFASFDLYNSIHGPQSNFMVLDEPDDGLDEFGIDRLINIIHSDLAPRFDNIFIISHRDAFRDVFPNTMTIAQDNRLSRIVEVL